MSRLSEHNFSAYSIRIQWVAAVCDALLSIILLTHLQPVTVLEHYLQSAIVAISGSASNRPLPHVVSYCGSRL